MQTLTPDWISLGEALIDKLDEVAEELDRQLCLEVVDPAYIVTTAIEDLRLFLDAVENDKCKVGVN